MAQASFSEGVDEFKAADAKHNDIYDEVTMRIVRAPTPDANVLLTTRSGDGRHSAAPNAPSRRPTRKVAACTPWMCSAAARI